MRDDERATMGSNLMPIISREILRSLANLFVEGAANEEEENAVTALSCYLPGSQAPDYRRLVCGSSV